MWGSGAEANQLRGARQGLAARRGPEASHLASRTSGKGRDPGGVVAGAQGAQEGKRPEDADKGKRAVGTGIRRAWPPSSTEPYPEPMHARFCAKGFSSPSQPCDGRFLLLQNIHTGSALREPPSGPCLKWERTLDLSGVQGQPQGWRQSLQIQRPSQMGRGQHARPAPHCPLAAPRAG